MLTPNVLTINKTTIIWKNVHMPVTILLMPIGNNCDFLRDAFLQNCEPLGRVHMPKRIALTIALAVWAICENQRASYHGSNRTASGPRCLPACFLYPCQNLIVQSHYRFHMRRLRLAWTR